MSLIKNALFNGSSEISTEGVAFASELPSSLIRTLTASSADKRTFTISFFIKKPIIGVSSAIIGGGSSSSVSPYETKLVLNSDDTISFVWNGNGGTGDVWKSTAVFRDVSEYYHILFNGDIGNATRADRVQLEVNGESITMTPTGAGGNSATTRWLSNTEPQGIGVGTWVAGVNPLTAYLSEFYLIDGQLLGSDNFIEINETTGQLIPKVYEGTYGTNGFYLNFSNGSNLGEDSSGNGNDFTNSNVVSTEDSPTNNHPTINSLIQSTNITNAGNTITSLLSYGGVTPFHASTIALPESGKWYCEISVNSISGPATEASLLGLIPPKGAMESDSSIGVLYEGDGRKYYDGVYSLYGAPYTTGDVIGIASNTDTNTTTFYKNNVSQGDISHYIRGYIVTLVDGTGTTTVNFTTKFTESSWSYSAPSGYKALNSKNLPTPDVVNPTDYFNTFLYEGNGAGLQVGDLVQDIDLYPLSNSGAFALEESDYLNRTPSVASTNSTTLTLSSWVKRSSTSGYQSIFSSRHYDGGTNGYPYTAFGISSGGELLFDESYNSTLQIAKHTNQKLIDTGKYYNIVLAINTSNGTVEDRVKIYIDGIRITSFLTSINAPSGLSITAQLQKLMVIGANLGAPAVAQNNFLDGYMSEINFIDGQQLSASDFGQTDGNGFWVPKQYSGSYGTNGFHLDFSNGSDLGEDSSGNNNDWTNNGVTQTIDNPSDNIAICDVADQSTILTVSESGTRVEGTTIDFGMSPSSLSPTSGKYYMEVLVNGLGNNATMLGVGTYEVVIDSSNQPGYFDGATMVNLDNQVGFRGINVDTTFIDAVSSFAINDVIGIALDVDNSEVTFYKNNVILGANNPYPITKLAPNYYFYISVRINVGTSDMTARYNSDSWSYTPPTGFVALTSNNILDTTFPIGQPDLVWIKNRDAADSHTLFDSTRGINNFIKSDTIDFETTDVNSLLQFNKGGFYLGSSSAVNTVNESYVAWNWKKGVTPGFDVVSYVGDNISGRLEPHSLGIKPDVVIIKNLQDSPPDDNWIVQHAGLTSGVNANNTTFTLSSYSDIVLLNTNNSVLSYIFDEQINGSGYEYIAYLWTGIEGFSKFGSYTGNGNVDGPFVYCGFRPAFIMIKNVTGAYSWAIYDTKRKTYNYMVEVLFPNQNLIESTTELESTYGIDVVSNGFKLRASHVTRNFNGHDYIYMAFAEVPYKYSRAR